MTSLRVLAARIRGVFSARRKDEDLRAEVEAHLDQLADVHRRNGAPPAAARAAARREFGGVDQITELYRDRRGFPLIDALGHDLRFAVRLAVRDRGAVATVIAVLGVAIGISAALLTVVRAQVRGLPVDHPEAIVAVDGRDAAGRPAAVTMGDVRAWQGQTQAFEGLAAYLPATMIVNDATRAPERAAGAYVSASALALLGDTPALGRRFTAEDEAPGVPPVVLLGDRLWHTRFQGNRQLVGTTIVVNQRPATVIGVMPPGFRFPMVADLWQPLPQMPAFSDGSRVSVFGRLRVGTRIETAQSELSVLVAQIAPQPGGTQEGGGVVVRPYVDSRALYPFVAGVMLAIGLLLLMACTNAVHLALARAARRSAELAIRASQGATRTRLLMHLLLEACLISTLATALGTAVAYLGAWALRREVTGIKFPYWQQWTIDDRVGLFIGGCWLGIGLVLWLIPSWSLSRSSLGDKRHHGGRSHTPSHARRWMGPLLSAEVAFTLALMVGAGLMARSLLVLYRSDAIVRSQGVVAIGVTLPRLRYAEAPQRTAFIDKVLERLRTTPGIASATVTSHVPFAATPVASIGVGAEPLDARALNATALSIGAGYFETLGVRLQHGRDFTAHEGTDGPPTAIVNARFAALYFPTTTPIGQRIAIVAPGADRSRPLHATIIGVTPSIRQQQPVNWHDADPVVYLPLRSAPNPSVTLLVRGRGEMASTAAAVRAVVRNIDTEVPIGGVLALDELRDQSRWANRIFAQLFGVCALFAFTVAALAFYAVTAYRIAQRRPEIGLRLALGAPTAQIVALVLRANVPWVALGLGLGGASGVGLGHLLESFLIATQPGRWDMLAVPSVLLAGVAIAAVVWPTLHAARLNPSVALRAWD